MLFAEFICDMPTTRTKYQAKYANSGMETQAFWTDDLSDQEEAKLLTGLATKIRKRKLETPAILFLEMHKPVSRLAGNALVVFSPFIAPFVGFQNVNDYSRLLMKPGAVEKLILLLEEVEEPEQESDAEPSEQENDSL